MVPIKPFDAWQHPDISDIAHSDAIEDDIDELIKGYKKSLRYEDSEVIFDCKKYMLVNPTHILDYTKWNKFRKIKSLNDLKTYSDVKDLVMDYRKQKEFDDKRLKQKKTGKRQIIPIGNRH